MNFSDSNGCRERQPGSSRGSIARTLGAVFALAMLPALATAAPCVVPDNGGGTVDLPPSTCTGYVSPDDLHMMINGLPPGTTIRIDAKHAFFTNVTRSPGGPLGGELETFQSAVSMNLQGTGDLLGFSRNLSMQAQCMTATAPRVPGTTPQSFDTDMLGLQGQLPPGDPDFDLLRITAGTNFGMPSPGHTTLTQQPGGNWAVDSFFDITYRIDFVGHPGGPLGGMSGSTTGTIRMRAGEPIVPPCTIVDDGTGTVHLPPSGCGYVSPADLHMMINGLPAGTTIQVAAEHNRFFPTGTVVDSTGETENFTSGLSLVMRGTGSLAAFHKTVNMNMLCQSHTNPRPPGPLQSFDTDMRMAQGQLPPGDPDFDLLRITGGTNFGMPSPGHTTLTLAGGNWNVDSFFDITYRIDFIGHPGGPLGGMSGSTTGTIRMQTGTTLTSSEPPPRPKQSALHQNVPNPFNPSTRISFDVAVPGAVKLQIFDVSGRLVRNLVDSMMQPRQYTMIWDGKDERGRQAPSGNYIAKLTAPDRTESRSMILLK